MSKELANKINPDPIPEEKENTPSSSIPTEELDERIEVVRNGEYVSKYVDSWEELWDDYSFK